MIYAYGVTHQGTYHVNNNIVCQDAHSIIAGEAITHLRIKDGERYE